MENESGREAVRNWLGILKGNTLGVTFYLFLYKKITLCGAGVTTPKPYFCTD